MLWIIFAIYLLLASFECRGSLVESETKLSEGKKESEEEIEKCAASIQRAVLEDRFTVAEDTPSRLYSTWMSEQCETRSGATYLIRKYSFFENGTFLLMRYHYAEESCSIATHTVVARGTIEILSASSIVSGATEAKINLDTVYIVPLNRQVAHKFERRLNVTCGPEPKWRPYTSHTIYERRPFPWSFSDSVMRDHHRAYNSPSRYSSLRRILTADISDRGTACLDALGIEFTELSLLRVERRRVKWPASKLQSALRVELLLGNLPRGAHSRRVDKPTWLQTTPLLRIDTTSGCPICGSVSRATVFNPPLLHETAPLPTLIGGVWTSTRCENAEGGTWSRRLFRIYSDDRLWTARWDYYVDGKCSKFLYAITAAGTYVQRAARHRRHYTPNVIDSVRTSVPKENTYRHIFRNTEASVARAFATILRGNQRGQLTPAETITTRRDTAPFGTSILELHIAESLLIPGDKSVSLRCGAEATGLPMSSWPRYCVPRAIEAPSNLLLRAKLEVNWSGQYSLLLASRSQEQWDFPLRRCSAAPSRNFLLKAYLGRSLALRFGLFPSTIIPSTPSNFSSVGSSCSGRWNFLDSGLFLFPVLLSTRFYFH